MFSIFKKPTIKMYNGENFYKFRGYLLPERLINMTGAGFETFDIISKQHIKNIVKYIGLKSYHNVVEIGCGIGRDAIPLTKLLNKKANYLGVDIIADSINWCQSNITKKHPNFKFVHFDVADNLHNSSGNIDAKSVVLPVADNSIDSIFLQSVFTHLLEEEVVHYLNEFNRILVPGGKVYATLFIYNDQVLTKARKTNLTLYDLKFEHEYGAGCRINNIEMPTGAVAYNKERVTDMVERSGLKFVRKPLHGSWSGYYDDAVDGQDVLILTK